MLDMFSDGFTLFMKGKLFRDYPKVFSQVLLGNFIALIVLVLLAKVGLPLWLAVVAAAAISGASQPWIFKDLKFD